MGHVTAAVRVMTKVVASPMFRAFSVLFDTPRKGQMPRKYVRTKLFIRDAEMNIIISFIAGALLHAGSSVGYVIYEGNETAEYHKGPCGEYHHYPGLEPAP